MTDSHTISRRASHVGLLTLGSRVLGLLRDAVVAYVFGTRMAADAFYVAFRIPNLLRRLLAEGSLTFAFVPVFTGYLRKSPEEGRRAANAVFSALCMVLLVVVALGVCFAPMIVNIVAAGFAEDPEKFALTVTLTRIMFPFIGMASLMAFMMGMLNSLKHFTAPAAAPMLLNIGIIFGALVLSHFFPEATVGLALGVLIGGAMQMAVQLLPLRKLGFTPHFKPDWKNPAIGEVGKMMLPSVYGSAVYQINVLVITLLASFLPSGSVSYLWYADRITELPLGIFAVAIATATLPSLSDHAADQDISKFAETLRHGLRVAMLEALPSAIGIILLAQPIVELLFERGSFGAESVAGTTGALIFFAMGIPFISGVRNTVPAFYALKDAKTPVKVATLALIVNAAVAFVLMHTMLHRGLALAMALSSAVNFIALLYMLRKKIGRLGLRSLIATVRNSALACTIMAAWLLAVRWWMTTHPITGTLYRAGVLLPVIAAGLAIYIVALRLISRGDYAIVAHLLHRKK